MRDFLSFSAASVSIERAVHAYNNLRTHASIGYLTPSQAHRRSGPLPLK
ncbi:integrase core domain-containing protein [Dyadobacter endophyticus]